MNENVFSTINDIYSKLEDDESRTIFIDLANYYMTGNADCWYDFVEKYYRGIGKYTRQTLIDFIDSLPKDRPIILYGAGKECSLYLDVWKKTGRVSAVCDKSETAKENGYYGIPVISPDELKRNVDSIVVVVSQKYRMAILRDLDLLGFQTDRIFCAPFVGEHIDNVGQYFDPHIVRFCDNEIFVDGGCLNLSTSLELRERVPGVKVHAFEPSPENYRRCMEIKNRESFDNATIYNLGLWSKAAELGFSDTGDGSSSVKESGETIIRVDRLDKIIVDEKVTFIKMDLEGAELEALKGARQIIQKCRPKMAISIYHKQEDLLTIPSLITEYVDNYKYFIRCYKNEFREVVLYAVPGEQFISD